MFTQRHSPIHTHARVISNIIWPKIRLYTSLLRVHLKRRLKSITPHKTFTLFCLRRLHRIYRGYRFRSIAETKTQSNRLNLNGFLFFDMHCCLAACKSSNNNIYSQQYFI